MSRFLYRSTDQVADLAKAGGVNFSARLRDALEAELRNEATKGEPVPVAAPTGSAMRSRAG